MRVLDRNAQDRGLDAPPTSKLFEGELENISNLLQTAANQPAFISNFLGPDRRYVPKCATPPSYMIGCDNDGGEDWSGGDCDSGHGAVDGDSSAPSVGSGGGCETNPSRDAPPHPPRDPLQ